MSTLFAYGQTGSGKTFTVDALAKGVAEELFAGGLEGEREVYLSCFELAGNVASGMIYALFLFYLICSPESGSPPFNACSFFWFERRI